MKKIVVIRTGGIGDGVLSAVFFNVLQKFTTTDLKIYWVGKGAFLQWMADKHPNLVLVEILETENLFRSVNRITTEIGQADSVIDLQRSIRSILIGLVLKLKSGACYTTWDKRSFFRTWLIVKARLRSRNKTFFQKNELSKSRIHLMAKASFEGLSKVFGQKHDFAFEFATNNKIKSHSLTIAPDSLFENKSMSETNWGTLLHHCSNTIPDLKIIFVGEEYTFQKAENIAKIANLKKANFENKCGKTTLSEVSEILSFGCLTLANDSAVTHMSESVGVPVFTFFGPTSESFGYAPYLENSKVFSLPLGCRPCSKDGSGICRFGDRKCFNDLDFNKIANNIRTMLCD
jgi:ADP-heptose:LPS heptosyltransferase